ncbi:amidase signature domain-containing protein [Lophiotrema nucula]|uniref:Amidase signature domain-containing protein n=1 Tax=Lophiotrema nucula TaxID=690887 RepID=A0A6A5YGL4_9PLEO|nr:amidase signature domain-containing protein [Lophiotrema nucula]
METHVPKLLDCTLEDLYKGVEEGSFTSVQLVEAYLARIEEVNDEFRAVIETNPDAMEIARRLDEERRSARKGSLGLLHGLPILLKDNIVTIDRMQATCGSLALVGAKPERESAITTCLRQSGAVILGKANMAEWAGFRSTSGCTGWSARGGQAKGIFVPGMKASGSSTGSAIAVALGLAAASIGSETIFSIVSPAERCGIIGFKPSRGMLPSEDIIFASQRLDTLGILSRTVKDSLTVLCELTSQAGGHIRGHPRDMLRRSICRSCSSLDLRGMRIGIPGNICELKDIHSARLKEFEKIQALLQTLGVEIVQDVNIVGAEEFENLPQTSKEIIFDTDLKIAINSYFKNLKDTPEGIRSLQDLIDCTKSCKAEEYPQRNVAGFERAQQTNPDAILYKRMLKREAYFAKKGGIAGALDHYDLDVLLVPALSVTMQTFATMAGSPVMSVPLGIFPPATKVEHDAKNGFVTVAAGIPFSAFIFGRKYADGDVLAVGDALERATNVRERLKPYKLPTSDLVDFVRKEEIDRRESISSDSSSLSLNRRLLIEPVS